MTDFDHRIMALKSEVEALKTIRRRSSTTLTTITKTVTCTAVLVNYNNIILCKKAGAIKITPINSADEFLYSSAIQPYSDRGRKIETYNWLFSDGSMGVMCVPFGSDMDDGMSAGDTKNVTITVYITSTSDFETDTSQITFNEV